MLVCGEHILFSYRLFMRVFGVNTANINNSVDLRDGCFSYNGKNTALKKLASCLKTDASDLCGFYVSVFGGSLFVGMTHGNLLRHCSVPL